MAVLFVAAPHRTRRGAALASSVALHLVLIGVAVVFGRSGNLSQPRRARVVQTFVMPAAVALQMIVAVPKAGARPRLDAQGVTPAMRTGAPSEPNPFDVAAPRDAAVPGIDNGQPEPPAVAAAAPAPAGQRVIIGGFDRGAHTPLVSGDRVGIVGGFGNAGGVRSSPEGPEGSVSLGGFGGVGSQAGVEETPLRLIGEIRPRYTAEAITRRVEGVVVLTATFRSDKKVQVLEILHSLGSGLDQQAVEAATQLTFVPATRSGRPVDVTTRVNVIFKLY